MKKVAEQERKSQSYGIIKKEKRANQEWRKMKRFNEQERKRLMLKSIIPGERIRLRDGALGHVQPRQWIFERIESDDTILLMDESGGFGWSVKMDHIDWEAYEKQKSKGLSQQN
ncbi:MAG TPA: hypothetical protein VMV04_19515 [Thermodesulfobacteriota bacterium]|nr:hypothetical protein [Thermodesulfobacteriota bacterium]